MEFKEWFENNQIERCHGLQRQSAQAAWDYQQAKLAEMTNAKNNLRIDYSQSQAKLQVAVEALDKLLMVSLPPSDVSGREMWNEAKATLEKIKAK